MMVISGVCSRSGLVLDAVLVATSSRMTSRFPTRRRADPAPRRSLGLLLMIVGFSTFCFTLLLHATSVSYGSTTHEA